MAPPPPTSTVKSVPNREMTSRRLLLARLSRSRSRSRRFSVLTISSTAARSASMWALPATTTRRWSAESPPTGGFSMSCFELSRQLS